jgi:putative Ig domain-containing protein
LSQPRSPRQSVAALGQSCQPHLVKLGLDLSLDLVRHRGLFPPGGQYGGQGLALLIILQRGGHVRTDLPVSSGSALDLLDQLVGEAYRYAFHTIIILPGEDTCTGSLSYKASGLPAGLSISSSTGLISGTPTTAATSSVTVTATDTTGASGSAAFSWTISAASGGCGAQQLIQNGGFATGSLTPWTASSGVLTAASSSHPSYPSTDPYLAWIDGYSGKHTDTLAQAVTIPASCTTATLSFWLYIDSNDPTSKAYDTFTTQVLNSAGTVLATLGTLSNQNEGTGYVQHSYSVSSFIGQTITIKFTGTETLGGGYDTSFFEDDNALNAD